MKNFWDNIIYFILASEECDWVKENKGTVFECGNENLQTLGGTIGVGLMIGSLFAPIVIGEYFGFAGILAFGIVAFFVYVSIFRHM